MGAIFETAATVWVLWCILCIASRPDGMSLRAAILACIGLNVALAALFVGTAKLA